MTKNDEPKYYGDPNYEDPLVKFWKKHQPWKRYVDAVGRLYARIDPQMPERVPIRIRSFLVLAFCLTFVGVLVADRFAWVQIYGMWLVLILYGAVTAIFNLREKSKSIFGSERGRTWLHRGWGAWTTFLCVVTFLSFAHLPKPGRTFLASVGPLAEAIAIVSTPTLILAAIAWVVHLERRFKVHSKIN